MTDDEHVGADHIITFTREGHEEMDYGGVFE
jgi:hypothetical protein